MPLGLLTRQKCRSQSWSTFGFTRSRNKWSLFLRTERSQCTISIDSHCCNKSKTLIFHISLGSAQVLSIKSKGCCTHQTSKWLSGKLPLRKRFKSKQFKSSHWPSNNRKIGICMILSSWARKLAKHLRLGTNWEAKLSLVRVHSSSKFYSMVTKSSLLTQIT